MDGVKIAFSRVFPPGLTAPSSDTVVRWRRTVPLDGLNWQARDSPVISGCMAGGSWARGCSRGRWARTERLSSASCSQRRDASSTAASSRALCAASTVMMLELSKGLISDRRV